MNQEEFWDVIESVKAKSERLSIPRERVIREFIENQEPEIAVKLNIAFAKLVAAAFNDKLKRAVYLITGYKQDYEFVPYIDYLITEGSEVYQAAINSPDKLANFPLLRNTENIEIEYRGSFHDVYEELTESEMPEFEFEFPEEELETEFNIESLKQEFPKLYKKYCS